MGEIDLDRPHVNRCDPVGIVRGGPEGERPRDEVETVDEAKHNDHHLRVAQGNEEIAPRLLAEGVRYPAVDAEA